MACDAHGSLGARVWEVKKIIPTRGKSVSVSGLGYVKLKVSIIPAGKIVLRKEEGV